jgi:hypothetical protein
MPLSGAATTHTQASMPLSYVARDTAIIAVWQARTALHILSLHTVKHWWCFVSGSVGFDWSLVRGWSLALQRLLGCHLAHT